MTEPSQLTQRHIGGQRRDGAGDKTLTAYRRRDVFARLRRSSTAVSASNGVATKPHEETPMTDELATQPRTSVNQGQISYSHLYPY